MTPADVIVTAVRHAPQRARQTWSQFAAAEREGRAVLAVAAAGVATAFGYCLAGFLRGLAARVMLPWRMLTSRVHSGFDGAKLAREPTDSRRVRTAAAAVDHGDRRRP